MAQIIKLRRSSVAGNVPTTSQLGLGELAINTADGKIYFEKNDGSVSIQTIVTTNSQTTGSIEITGNISGSATSTGSFGAVIADNMNTSKLGGKSPLVIEADNINVDSSGNYVLSGNISGSAASTGSFGRLTVGDSGDVNETYKVNITGDKGLYINHTGGAWDAQGIRLDTSATTGRGATIYGDDFTTGALVWLETNSSDTGEHYALNIHQNHVSAVGSIPLRVTQDATDAMAAVFQGGEGKTGRVGIYADEGDDNDDKWMFEATTGAQFQLRSYQPGSWATSFLVDQANTKFHLYENLDLSSGDFDVSGSAASTGSFGSLVVADAIQGRTTFKDGSSHQIYIDPDVSGTAEIGTDTYSPLRIKANNNQVIYINQGGQTTFFGNVVFNANLTGDGDSEISNMALISGSAASTGSFGHLTLAGAESGNVTGHLVPSADGTFDLGTTNAQDWRNIYARHIDLSNSQFTAEVGSSTVLFADHAAIGNGFRFTHRNTKLFEVGDSSNRSVISGSAVSTGSFGRLILGETSNTALAIGHEGTDSDQNTVDIRSNDSSTSLRLVSNNDANDYYDAIFRANYNDLNSVELEGPSGRVFLEYRHTGRKTLIGNTAGNTDVVSTILSGSAISTGSFGRMEIDEISSTGGSGNILIKTSANTNTLKLDPANSGFSANTNLFLGASNGNNSVVVSAGAGTNPKLSKNGSGEIEFGSTISGSATTTASFGHGFIEGDLVVGGSVTAQEFHTEFVSSSILFESGSTQFGNTLDDIHNFTGSLNVTGSTVAITDGNITLGDAADGATNTIKFGAGGDSKMYHQADINYWLATNGTQRIANYHNNLATAFDIQTTVGGSTTTKFVVMGSGNVGIGTTSPAEALHVAGKAYIRRTGTATAHGDTDLFVADSTAGGSTAQLQILGGASGQSFLYFSDTNSYSVGGIKYFHSDNRMAFRANDTDILDITSTKISGSAASTGSFGKLFTDSHADVQGQLFIQPQNNTNNSTTAEEMVIYGAGSEAGIAIVANADANSYYTSYIKARYDGAEGFYIKGPSGDKFLSYGHSGTNTRIGVSDTAGTLHLRAQMISGSSVSTGSFGHIVAADTVAIGKSDGLAQPGDGIILDVDGRIRVNDGLISYDNHLELGTGWSTRGINLKTGTATGNLIRFYTGDGSAQVERFRITDTGISGSAAMTASFGHLIVNGNTISAGGGGGSSVWSVANNNAYYTSGLVGIGEASPDELLHIKSSTASAPVIKLENAGDVTNGAQLHFVMSTTGEGDNDIPGTIRFKGMNSADAETEFATIYVRNIDVTDGTEDSEMHFRTQNAGSLESAMMIKSGIVGIGTTSPNSNSMLHIVDGAGTMPTTHAGDSLIVQNNANTSDVAAIYAIAGTAGSSHIVFGDADSKNPGRVSYYHDGNYMSFHTNVNEYMRLTSDGKLGIGTTSPLGNKVHIHVGDSGVDSVTTNSSLVIESNTNNFIQMLNPNGNNSGIIFGEHTDIDIASILHDGGDNSLRFKVAAAEVVRINGSGNVGIGTTSPSNKLTVEDTIGIKRSGVAAITTLQMAGSGLIVNGHSGYHPLIIQANGTEVARFKNDGLVGIGTSSPETHLHIVGNSTSGNSPAIRLTPAGANDDARIDFEDQGGTVRWYMGYDGSTEKFIIASDENGFEGSNVMLMDDTGNVGIGTTSPGLYTGISGTSARYVSVVGTAASTLELGRDATNNGYAVGRVQFVNTNNADASNADDDGKGIAYISSHVVTSDSNAGDDSGGDLRFITKPEAGTWAERMRIQSSGVVNIGTDSIGKYEFDSSTGGATPVHYFGRNTTNASYPIATFNHAGGTSPSLWVGTTKISGSAASTGSFGDGRIAGRLGIQTSGTPRGPIDVMGSLGSQGFYLSDSGGAVKLPTDVGHSSGAGTFDFQVENFRLGRNGTGKVSVYPRFDKQLNLGTTDDTDLLVLSGSTKISGSAVSTGSFGAIRTGTTVGSLSSGIALGDGDSGIYEASDDAVVITAGNSLESFRVNSTTIRARTSQLKLNTTDNTTYGIILDTANNHNKITLNGSGTQTINMSKYGRFETTTTQNTSAANFFFTGSFDQIANFSATAQFFQLKPNVSSSATVATSSFTTLDLAGTIDMTGQTQETIRGIYIHPTKTNINNYIAIDADGDIVTSGNVQLNNNKGVYFKRSTGTADPHIIYDSSNNFKIFNPVSGEIQLHVGSAEIAAIDSGGLTFNGSKTIGSSAGSGVITIAGNSGLKLKSSLGGGSGDIEFMHGSTTHAVIDTSGRLGIGTTSPTKPLEITGTGAHRPMLIKSTSDHNTFIEMDSNRSAANSYTGGIVGKWNGTEVSSIYLRTGADTTNKDDGDISFHTAAAGTVVEKMRLKSDGKLGIGTQSPSHALDVQNAGETIIQAKATSSGRAKLHLDGYDNIAEIYFARTGANKGAIYQHQDGSNLNVYSFSGASYGYEIMTWQYSNGRVGIKQESPSYDLDVTGNIRSTSYAFLGNIVVGNANRIYTANEDRPYLQLNATTIQITGGNNAAGENIVNLLRRPDTHFSVVSGSTELLHVTSSGAKVTGNLDVTGTITAQEFHTEFVSSSIIHESGSTKFGDSDDDIHNFSGSIKIDGANNATNLEVIGLVTGHGHSDSNNYFTFASGTGLRFYDSNGEIKRDGNIMTFKARQGYRFGFVETNYGMSVGTNANTTHGFHLALTGSAGTALFSNEAGGNPWEINPDGNNVFSGSATSTGSFGKLLGDASDLTNLPSGYTVANSANNRILTSVDSTNANAESNLTFDGSTLTHSASGTNVKLDFNGGGTAAGYNYFMRAANDGGNKAVHFVNGSTRSADNGPNVYTIRNDGGELHLGRSNQITTIDGSAVRIENGNVSVTKSFPDIFTKSDNEGRIGFMDAGGAIQSGMKNNSGDLILIADGNTERVRVNDSGMVVTGNVSGSATSTGSFGNVVTDTINQAAVQFDSSGRIGFGTAPQSGYQIKATTGVWLANIQQINNLAGSSGVGNIKYYNGGASLRLQVYGPHGSSENPKGIVEIGSQDVSYSSLASHILHADPRFLDNPSLVIRSRSTGFNYAMMNYHTGSNDGLRIYTHADPAVSTGDITFYPSGSEILNLTPTQAKVSGDISLPLDASSVSHKLKLTGDGTSEIYRNSYDLYLTTSLTHYHVGSNGLTLKTSDNARQIYLRHTTSLKRLSSNMSAFNIYAGHSGALGFLTEGSTSGYSAIEQVYTDNNTGGLKFNTKASGTDTERMRITSAGNVGIGTTNPGTKAHIYTTGAGLKVEAAGTSPFTQTIAEFRYLGNGNNITIQNIMGAASLNSSGTMQIASAGTIRLSMDATNSTFSNNIVTSGNVSGSATSTGSFGHLKLGNADTDASFEFGRAHVGNIGYSDMAGFSHVDNDGTQTFALAQSAAGKTIVNAKNGQIIALKVNNADIASVTATGVGIGIESPTRKLQVNASSYTEAGGADANIHFSVANSTWSGIGIFGGSSQGGFIDFGDTDATHRGRILYSHASDYMAFNTSATEKVRITSGGNVGIGITSPYSKLDVKGTNVTPANANGGNHTMQVVDTTTLAAGTGGGIGLGGYFNGTSDTIFAEIRGIKENATSANYASALTLHTRANGGNITERFRIDSSGNVGIGDSTPSYKLDVAGTGRFTGALTVGGTFSATSKSFLIDHPSKENKKLQYGSLEGPEFGVYVRGKSDGENVVELPDYWKELVDEDSITVQITALGSWQKLYVKKIEDNKVYVGKFGFGSPKFFYTIYGERKDIDKLEVEPDVK